jgi:hypothetical protein
MMIYRFKSDAISANWARAAWRSFRPRSLAIATINAPKCKKKGLAPILLSLLAHLSSLGTIFWK